VADRALAVDRFVDNATFQPSGTSTQGRSSGGSFALVFGVGTRVGPYELVAELGRGGMGVLYVGRQSGLGGFSRRVAIKIIHPEVAHDLEMVHMFLDEARLGGAVRHPAIVHVEGIGEHEGRPYLVMDYVEGFTLAAALRAHAMRRAPIAVDVAVSIAMQLADALHAAHETRDEHGQPLGLVHRDVSPQNVLVDARGHVKLIDFGVAKARHRLASTKPGAVKGKLAYMAPEQLDGRSIDRRADVFALGVLLWEMLTLERLFAAPSDVETILRIRDVRPIDPPSTRRRDLPPRLDDVVLTMLSRSLDERFSTAAASRFALMQACPAALAITADRVAALDPRVAPSPGEEPTAPARPTAR
jgi:serine/threonine-protein kinase